MIIIIIVVVKIMQSTWFPNLIQKKCKRSREDRTSQNSKGPGHYLSPEGGEGGSCKLQLQRMGNH